MSRPVRHRARGFTLLELLITMVVTIFGLMGIMALHVSLTQGNDSASRTQEAIAVGAQSMEMLRSKRITDMANTLMGSTSAIPPMDVPNFTTILGRNNVSYTVDVHVTLVPPTTNLWRVRVEVKWTDDGSLTAHTVPFEVIRTVQEAL